MNGSAKCSIINDGNLGNYEELNYNILREMNETENQYVKQNKPDKYQLIFIYNNIYAHT